MTFLVKRTSPNGRHVEYLHRANGFVYGPCSAKPTVWKTRAGAEAARQRVLTYGWKPEEVTIIEAK